MTSTLTFNETTYQLHYYEPNGIPSFAIYINDELNKDYHLELVNGKDSYYKGFQLFYKGFLAPIDITIADDKPTLENVVKVINYINMMSVTNERIVNQK